MCAVFLLGRRLYAFLERLVSDDVRAGARCNGTFSETCEIPRLNAKKSLMNPSQYFFVIVFEISSLQSSNRCARLQESHRTLRDGPLLGGVPGTSCQATIAPSLRDKSHSPSERPRIKLALLGLKPRAETCRPLVGAISRLIPCKCPNSRALRAVKQAAETEAFDDMLLAWLWPKGQSQRRASS